MRTVSYRVRIEAIGPDDDILCAMEQSIDQATLSKARPRELIRFVERMIREFIHGHTAAEKRIAKTQKVSRPRVKKLGLCSLLREDGHDHAS